jgi:F-type H+-transporting ATPase subunit delta
MRTSRALAKQIVATYAGALYDAAAGDDAVDKVSTQLDAVVRLARSHAPLRDALTDDAVAGEQRSTIVREVFAGLFPALVDTLAVMVERDNFDLLSSVVDQYGVVSEERRGVVSVDVTTAVTLTDVLRQSITAKLSADLGKAVALREKVDPAIIGGIVISTHGHRIDASIASQLESARLVLSTAPTGGEA